MTNVELVKKLMARDTREDLRHAYHHDMWFHTAVDMIMVIPEDDAVIDVLLSSMEKMAQELARLKKELNDCESRRIAPGERRGAF